MKKYIMPIRETDRKIFNLIKSGEKKVETRGAGPKYEHIKEGDILVFKCGKDKFEREIIKRYLFKSIESLLKKYSVSDILPLVRTPKELKKIYYSFPGYEERIKKYGILVFELAN